MKYAQVSAYGWPTHRAARNRRARWSRYLARHRDVAANTAPKKRRRRQVEAEPGEVPT
jgi:hypothetical protein